ncbi:MAG TPA: NlpC/P60 family protein [Jatrophihabitantaceae bacterium]
MDACRSRRLAARAAALVAVVAVTAGLMVAPQSVAKADPPNPSNGALKGAAAKKAQLADRVGQLSAQVADLENEVAQRQAAAELAEQKYALARQKLEQAKAQVIATRQRQVQAQQDVDKAAQQFSAFVRASYMSSPITGPASGLLTADDPTALLGRSDITEYAAAHRLDIIGSLTRAKVAKTNATSAARAAEIAQAKAKDAAEQARNAAEAALSAARAEQQALSDRLAATQSALTSARLQLATLTNQRARYLKWQHDQAVARAKRAAAEAAARRAAEEAARRHQNSGGGWNSSPPPPPAGAIGGSWTAAAGQAAANRAMRYLGIAYAFAAGGYYGPSYGVCVSGDAWNDCHVFGFDCSGLAMYAWGPWAHWDHYAATQYGQAGSYHPDSGALMPGDLVFWSSNGTQSGIHHVAIYIGGGNVIQAPQSGDIVRVTPLWQVDSGYFGATRPLT